MLKALEDAEVRYLIVGGVAVVPPEQVPGTANSDLADVEALEELARGVGEGDD